MLATYVRQGVKLHRAGLDRVITFEPEKEGPVNKERSEGYPSKRVTLALTHFFCFPLSCLQAVLQGS